MLAMTQQEETRLDKQVFEKISFEQRLQELMQVERQLKKKLNKTVKRALREEANLERVQKESKEEQELQK